MEIKYTEFRNMYGQVTNQNQTRTRTRTSHTSHFTRPGKPAALTPRWGTRTLNGRKCPGSKPLIRWLKQDKKHSNLRKLHKALT